MSIRDLTLSEFIGVVGGMGMALHDRTHDMLERAAKIVEAEVKREFGTYQEAAPPFLEWEPLTDGTMQERVALGFSENQPLLRTGELRDSVGHIVEVTGAATGVATVGSPLEKAVYQEVGTAHIPPRSTFGGALVRKSEEIVAILGSDVQKALVGQGVLNGAVTIK